LTELVALAAVASLQHYSVDRLTEFDANLAIGPLTVAAKHWAVEFESVAEKTIDAWAVYVAVASQRTVEVVGVVIAQIVELN
jgi:hypothetical protein